MRKLIIQEEPAETITLQEWLNAPNYSITAYLTANKTGLGILVSINSEHGFLYHSQLIEGRNPQRELKFLSDSRSEAVEKALSAGRSVVLFENFPEFLTFSAKYSKL